MRRLEYVKRMKYCWIVLLLTSIACTRKIHSSFLNTDLMPSVAKAPDKTTIDQRGCYESASYIMDTLHKDHMPTRYLRVSFHFMNSIEGNMNFGEDSGRVFVHKLLHVMQILFDTNIKLWLPKDNAIPVIPVNIKYKLHGDSAHKDGIYFHYDDDLYYYIHQGSRRNNADWEVLEKYGVGLDSVLNIFIMPHHPDSARSKTYQSGCVGIALGNAVKISGIFEKGFNEWNVRGTFNHEVGHVLGLYHAWTYDGCEDTPMHSNKCWVPENPGCKDNTSNNMMDYNAWQTALSPCQVGIIHKNLSNTEHPARKLLLKTWCQYDAFKSIQIKDSIVWLGARDVEGDIEVMPGASLTIKCRVSMPPGSRIKLHPGSTLILDDGLLHNDCGKTWQGILVMKKGRKSGLFKRYGGAKVENVL